jgi:hypothetical protein
VVEFMAPAAVEVIALDIVAAIVDVEVIAIMSGSGSILVE